MIGDRRRGGGVCMEIKTDIHHSDRFDCINSSLDSLYNYAPNANMAHSEKNFHVLRRARNHPKCSYVA